MHFLRLLAVWWPGTQCSQDKHIIHVPKPDNIVSKNISMQLWQVCNKYSSQTVDNETRQSLQNVTK